MGQASFERMSVDLLAPTCVYMAARMEGYPRTSKEIAVVSSMAANEIGGLAISISKCLNLNLGRVLPEDYVNRIASILNVINYSDYAVNICKNINSIDLGDHTTPSVIAACSLCILLLGCNSLDKLHILPDAAFVSITQIKKCYNMCHPYLSAILPVKLPPAFDIANLPSLKEMKYFDLNKIKNVNEDSKQSPALAQSVSSSSFDTYNLPASSRLNSHSYSSSSSPTIISAVHSKTPTAIKINDNTSTAFSTSTSKEGWSALKKRKLS